MTEPDHLVIGCLTLAQGRAWAGSVLGVEAAAGGAHAGRGTHNRLVGMGPDFYLELLAPDPDQPGPAEPRLLGLDDPGLRRALLAGPRPIAWVARTDRLDALLAALGPQAGAARAMTRGALRWRLAEPLTRPDPTLPALIEWPDGVSAAARLPDSGLRLRSLEAGHPDPDALRRAWAARGLDGAAGVHLAARPRLSARLSRPDGSVVALHSDGSASVGNAPG